MLGCLAWGFFGVEAFHIVVLRVGALNMRMFSSKVFRAGALNIDVFNILAGPVAPWMLHCRTPLEAPSRPQRGPGVHRHQGFAFEGFLLGPGHTVKSQLWDELGSLTL